MPKKYIDEQEAKIAWYRELGATSKRAAIAVDLVFDRVPAADVEEVKHGKWKRGEEVGRAYLGSVCFGIVYDGFTCSSCGYKIDRDCQKVTWSYCPNCGAKMDVKESNE